MKRKLLDGVVKRHPDGFGFFVPEDPEHPDVYIPKHSMTGIMTNDRVRVSVFDEPGGGGRYRGDIEQVLRRSVTKLMGRFTKAAFDSGIILDKESSWGGNILIPKGKTMNAQDDDLVVVKIITYSERGSDLAGEVTELLGKGEDPLYDTRRVVFAQGIPDEWPTAALNEAKKLPKEVAQADFKNRKDLRALDFVTIDGATAKDFDDAILVETNDRGFHIYVAIADVSHYVKPESAIDEEAYVRGNSTYFPYYVIPMLPEELSNELCSLKPNVPRLALVADMQVDFTGAMITSTFYEAVIQSKARVIYGEAQEVFDGTIPPHLKHVVAPLNRAADVAKVLMAKRFKDGSMDLEIPETQIILDETGNPIDIVKADRIFANRVIEELMLLANIAVAKFIGENDRACLYRIHEAPATESLETLNRFLAAFGADREISGGQIQKKITRALQAFDGKPQAEILSILTLRSMKQAKYSPANLGHFGLGFTDYAHFTSPIRRYPDLIIHRTLKNIVVKGGGYAAESEEDLATAGTHLSGCEQRSAKAERQFKAIKRARFMRQFLGKEFDGMISSVTKFGVFVLLRAYDVDGLVRMEDLGNEPFEFDEETMSLVGKKTRLTYALGDPIKVQVATADADEGRVNFVLAGAEESVSRAPVGDRPPKKSGFRSSKFDKKPNQSRNDNPRAERSRGDRRKDKWKKHESNSQLQPKRAIERKADGDSESRKPQGAKRNDRYATKGSDRNNPRANERANPKGSDRNSPKANDRPTPRGRDSGRPQESKFQAPKSARKFERPEDRREPNEPRGDENKSSARDRFLARGPAGTSQEKANRRELGSGPAHGKIGFGKPLKRRGKPGKRR